MNVWYYQPAAILVFFAKSIIHGSQRCCSSVLLVKLQVTFEVRPDQNADVCSGRKAPATGDHGKWKTKPSWKRDQSKTASSLTYDDVGLARAGTGVHTEVALDLVSSLIEQIQVVFHRVSIMKTLAQTDDTWCRGEDTIRPLKHAHLLDVATLEAADICWLYFESVPL